MLWTPFPDKAAGCKVRHKAAWCHFGKIGITFLPIPTQCVFNMWRDTEAKYCSFWFMFRSFYNNLLQLHKVLLYVDNISLCEMKRWVGGFIALFVNKLQHVILLEIMWMWTNHYCYASAFRRQRHYVFGLSLRPKPEIPSFDLYMGPLVHPTNGNRFMACPSVRPSVRRGFRAFAGECMEGLAWNFTCWCILPIFRTD